MKNFVLVHGSWYGAWCWGRVAEQLRASGHRVSAPDLPAHGADQTPPAEASLASYLDRVARAIDEVGGKAHVIGHSMAGVVLSELGERHPERVDTLVYLAAYLLGDGETIFQHATTDAGSALGPHLRPDEKSGVIAVADEGFASALAWGCSDADVATARARARPDPLGPLATPIHITEGRYGKVPRAYIKTLADRAVSTSLQAKLLGATKTTTFELSSGHSPFFSHAEELSEVIVRAAG